MGQKIVYSLEKLWSMVDSQWSILRESHHTSLDKFLKAGSTFFEMSSRVFYKINQIRFYQYISVPGLMYKNCYQSSHLVNLLISG